MTGARLAYNEAQPRDDHGRWSDDPSTFDGGEPGGAPEAGLDREAAYALLDDADTPEQVQAALDALDVEKVEWGEGATADPVYVIISPAGEVEVVEWDGETAYTDVTPAAEWVDAQDPSEFFPNYEDEWNDDFWSEGGMSTIYHATTDDHLEGILADGLQARAETRGLSNRWEGDAVYTSTNEAVLEAYGEQIIAIDLDAMRRDGVTPYASQEPEIVDYELATTLAAKIGIEDYSPDVEEGMDPDTVVIHGDIPPQYLSSTGSTQAAARTAYTESQPRDERGRWTDGTSTFDAGDGQWEDLDSEGYNDLQNAISVGELNRLRLEEMFDDAATKFGNDSWGMDQSRMMMKDEIAGRLAANLVADPDAAAAIDQYGDQAVVSPSHLAGQAYYALGLTRPSNIGERSATEEGEAGDFLFGPNAARYSRDAFSGQLSNDAALGMAWALEKHTDGDLNPGPNDMTPGLRQSRVELEVLTGEAMRDGVAAMDRFGAEHGIDWRESIEDRDLRAGMQMAGLVAVADTLNAHYASQPPEDRAEAFVSHIMESWADSASKNSTSLAFQAAVAEEFGAGRYALDEAISGWERATNRDIGAVPRAMAEDEGTMAAYRSVVRAMYEDTQRVLNSDQPIRLYRGYEPGSEEQASIIDAAESRARAIEVEMNPASSWTTSPMTARHFGSYMLQTAVPPRQILATAMTGNGALTEQEVILIGAPTPALVGEMGSR